MIISLPAGCPAGPRLCGVQPTRGDSACAEGQATSPLFGLAPSRVFRAPPVSRRAVGSYPAFSPLPLTCVKGGLFSVTLSVRRRFPGNVPRILHGGLPEGVRTFLPGFLADPGAIICLGKHPARKAPIDKFRLEPFQSLLSRNDAVGLAQRRGDAETNNGFE